MEVKDMKWRRSSYSSNGGGNCVEVAAAHVVAVRDSKNMTGPTLGFRRDRWRMFTESLKGK